MGDTSGMTMKDSTQPVLAHYFTYRLNTLSKLNDMASQAMYTAHTGLTLPEVRTLAAVGASDELTVNQLALEVNLDKGQASRLAATMARKGFIARRADEHDKRRVHLKLTRSGRAMWKKVMPLIEQRNDALLGCLGARERAQLLDIFERLLAQEKTAQLE